MSVISPVRSRYREAVQQVKRNLRWEGFVEKVGVVNVVNKVDVGLIEPFSNSDHCMVEFELTLACHEARDPVQSYLYDFDNCNSAALTEEAMHATSISYFSTYWFC